MRPISVSIFSLIGLLFLCFVSCGQQPQSKQEEQTIVHMAPEDFRTAIEGNKVILIDLRTPGELEEGIIQGATHLDYFGDGFEDNLKDLNLKEHIYLYCQSGGRSGDAAEKLESLGAIKVYNLDGGIEAWLEEKLSLVKP